ncbi:MAG: phosphatase PAP2 family protein [Ignavibacteriae bacterium]|nr:phosphatase PAP2 family protein [Ignavibacteriota bacterium]
MKSFILPITCLFAGFLISGCSDRNTLPTVSVEDVSQAGIHTFVLSSANDPRLPIPMEESALATADDDRLVEIALGHHSSRAEFVAVEHPLVLWNRLTTKLGTRAGLPPPRFARAYALVHVAIYDALVAAHVTRRRDLVDRAIAAGAASNVLLYLFPNDSTRIRRNAMRQLVVEHGLARGRLLRSWVLGRRVGELVVQYGKNDRSDLVFTGEIPTGDGIWTGTNPVLPMCGEWKTWILSSGEEFQPEPPYLFGSHEDSVDVQEVYEVSLHRTPEQIAVVHAWADLPPPTIWCNYLNKRINRLHLRPFTAARAFAYLTATMYDGFVSCWRTKYTYWTARPFQRIPGLVTVITTPNFPSYSSGHSTISAAASVVMGELFPGEADYFTAQAEEAAISRLWGGIHFRHDNEQGLVVGQRIGEKAVAVMRSDPRGPFVLN